MPRSGAPWWMYVVAFIYSLTFLFSASAFATVAMATAGRTCGSSKSHPPEEIDFPPSYTGYSNACSSFCFRSSVFWFSLHALKN